MKRIDLAPSSRCLQSLALVGVFAMTSYLMSWANQHAKAATPRTIDEKLDRIFIFTAVDEEGTPIIVRNIGQKANQTIYASISTQGLGTIERAIRNSNNPNRYNDLRLIPTTLNYFLKTWEELRKKEPTLGASIVPDLVENRTALDLLERQGFSRLEAEQEMGVDVAVFCPVPAVYAEETRQTTHRRLTGKRFIPCSLSATSLTTIIAEHLKRRETALVPIPLWKLINNLSKENDAAVSSLEVITHPSVIAGMETARNNNQYTRGRQANSGLQYSIMKRQGDK